MLMEYFVDELFLRYFMTIIIFHLELCSQIQLFNFYIYKTYGEYKKIEKLPSKFITSEIRWKDDIFSIKNLHL